MTLRNPRTAASSRRNALHLDYGAKAAAYVGAFMAVIHWLFARALYNAVAREASNSMTTR